MRLPVNDVEQGGPRGSAIGFYHVGFTVSDTATAVAFFSGTLGIPVSRTTEASGQYLRSITGVELDSLLITVLDLPGGGAIELLEYRGGESTTHHVGPADPGTAHLCLYVEGIDALIDRAHAAGVRTLSDTAVAIETGPTPGSRVIYMDGPDGIIVECYETNSP